MFSSCALENTEKTRCFRAVFEKTEKAENTRKLGVFELGARMHRKRAFKNTQKRGVFELGARKHENTQKRVFSSWALENTEKTRCFRAVFETTGKSENARKLDVFELGARMHRKRVFKNTQKLGVFELGARKHENTQKRVFSSWALESAAPEPLGARIASNSLLRSHLMLENAAQGDVFENTELENTAQRSTLRYEDRYPWV